MNGSAAQSSRITGIGRSAILRHDGGLALPAFRIELDRAALSLARLEYPDLDPQPFLTLLDSHAMELAGRGALDSGGEAFVLAANEYLFAELGFSGNTGDYYAPPNSCLNDVLTSRTGIPITLSLVYMEIARRLAKPVRGIGLPGHFIVQYDDGQYSTYIDPFHGGRLLGPAECFELARRMSGVEIAPRASYLLPASKRDMLHRMLNNLRSVYLSRRSHRKVLDVLNVLSAAGVLTGEDYKLRSAVWSELGQYRAAASDLEEYLRLSPGASDRAAIEQRLREIRQYLARLN
jgi:regulator of sirC expression with transglutaminase-like and TPR domain